MKLPDFSYEHKLWVGRDDVVIAGMDEVGRGALAGPVVTASVIFRPEVELKILVNDSKKLSSKQRLIADKWIKENSLSYGIGTASVAEINKFGIVSATNKAFRRSLINCGVKVDYLLVDAFYVPYVKGVKKKNQIPIIKGDSLSISIAAASIIGKVARDALMTKLEGRKNYQVYNWGRNYGYGTLHHREMIKKHGPTHHHRKLFIRKILL